MSDKEAISAKEKEQIKFAFENAMDLLKTQKARGERIELSILKGDTPTFMEYPLAKKPQDLQGADAAILGIPFEGLTIQTPMIMAPPTCGRPPQGSVYWRMGADQGTDMIRKYSIYYSINHNRGYFPEIDKDLVFENHIRVVDYGDVPYTPDDIEGNLERAEEKVADIVAAGAVPIILGGDHTVPTPTLRAILKPRTKKIGLIVFDSHMDLSHEPKNWASTEWSQVLELGKISPENFVCVGIRGVRNSIFERNVARELGHRVITIDEVKECGIKDVMNEAIKLATNGTDGIYFSLDIDVMDPSQVMSQKAPEFWGLTMDEMFHALRRITREKIIGCDINEYTPDYDLNGMGAQFCARVAAEFLGGIALRKRDGK
jgi:arginase family enzyme